MTFNEIYASGEYEINIQPHESDPNAASLMENIKIAREDVLFSVSLFKSSLAVINDWMKEVKHKPGKYAELFGDWAEDIIQQKAVKNKYHESHAKETDSNEDKKYRVFPDLAKVAVNTDIYAEVKSKLGVSNA